MRDSHHFYLIFTVRTWVPMNLTLGGRSGLSKGLQFASTLFVSLQKNNFLLEMGTIATLTPELPLLSGWCGCAYASSILVCTDLV